jgi:hypothetical protein
MSKSKNKKNAVKEINRQIIVDALFEAFNRMEGEYSGIPLCCIDEFVGGRTAYAFNESLSEKDKKKYKKWNYVPCDDCFQKDKMIDLKQNGTSHRGQVLFAIIETFLDEEEK